MRAGDLFFSAVQVLMIAGIFFCGGFLLAMGAIPELRFQATRVVLNPGIHFSMIGSMLVVFGVILSIVFYSMNRRRFYQVGMAYIDPNVIRGYIENHLVGTSLDKGMVSDVRVHGNQMIEVIAQMGDLEPEQQKARLAEFEREVGELLNRKLGSRHEFLLTVVVGAGS